MPKKPSDSVITHRIELGTLERREMKQTLDALQKEKQIENFQQIGLTVAVAGVGAGVGYGIYKIAEAMAGVFEKVEKVADVGGSVVKRRFPGLAVLEAWWKS